MVAFPSAWVSHYEKQSPLLTDNVQVVWAGNKSFFTILKLKMQALNINLKYWDCLLLQLHIGEGDGTPLQRSCLENPMDGGAWWAAVHGVEKSRTRLSNFTFTFHFHALEKEMATHSSVLAWRIPGTGEPVGLPSVGSHRVGHDWRDLAAAAAIHNVTPSIYQFTLSFPRHFEFSFSFTS